MASARVLVIGFVALSDPKKCANPALAANHFHTDNASFTGTSTALHTPTQ